MESVKDEILLASSDLKSETKASDLTQENPPLSSSSLLALPELLSPKTPPNLPITSPSDPSEEPLTWRDLLFVITALMSSFNIHNSWGGSMMCIKEIGAWLGTNDKSEFSWMLATYGLTAGLAVIITGRLGDMYGHKNCLLLGYLLFTILHISTAFCRTPLQFDIVRAIAGIAAALVMPNSGALLARRWEKGRRRMVVFALMGAGGPMGYFSGALAAAAITNSFGPRWIFFIFGIIACATGLVAIFAFPEDQVTGEGNLDLIGCSIGVIGLVLFMAAWNSAVIVGWETPYVYVMLVLSILFLIAFYFFENWKGDDAIIPMRLFTKEVICVCIALWWTWMTQGSFIYYTSSFLRDFRGITNPVTLCLQFVAMAPAGIFAAMSLIFLFRIISPHHIFALAMIAYIIGNLLSALAGIHQSYWALTFPAVVIEVFGPDLSYASAALIIANSAPRDLQGVASGLVVALTSYSTSVGLGLAGTVEYYIERHHTGDANAALLAGYRAALWLGVGLSVAGLIIVILFVRTKPAQDQEEMEVSIV